MKPYDLVVVGAGSAGLSAALGAAAVGARTLLVEKSRLGGGCLHDGCVPSKALLRAARAAHEARTATRFGVHAQVQVKFSEVMHYVRQVIARIQTHESPERLRASGVELIFGSPRFVSPSRLEVNGTTIAFRRALLATGSRTKVPEMVGLEETPYLTNETVFGLTELPPRLLVLGGGPVGCELAQAFSRLGSRVSLVQRSSRLLPSEDSDAQECLEKALCGEGLTLHLGQKVRRIVASQAELETGERIPFDRLLLATGRMANSEGLELEAAGIALDSRGYIRTDDYLRTTAANIWAAGDVRGNYLFSHMAEHEAKGVLLQALFGIPLKPSFRIVPRATFTDPEIARVGPGERELRAKGEAVEVWRHPFGAVDRAITDDEAAGFCKILTGQRGRIVGATVVGLQAADLLQEIVLAMDRGLTPSALSNAIHIYPTLGLGIRTAADRYALQRTIPAWLLRFVQKLYGFNSRRTPTQILLPEKERE